MTSKAESAGSREELVRRLEQLERTVSTLLGVVLRGNLQAPERRHLQRALGELKARQRRRRKEPGQDSCPACLAKLPQPRARRCPFCGVLLAEARRAARELQARSRSGE